MQIPKTLRVNLKAIDEWPITLAGLPPRVVHSAQDHGLSTVGDLRAISTTQIRGIGTRSMRQVKRFLDLTGQLAAGSAPFDSMHDLFSYFLNESQMEVIAQRFGLRAQEDTTHQERHTLQSIGDARRISRERVRQLESSAIAMLKSRMAQTCLDPYYNAFCQFLTTQGGAITPAEIVAFPDPQLLEGFSPLGVLRLLAVCRESPTEWCGFYTTLPRQTLEQLHTQLHKLFSERPVMGAGETAAFAGEWDLHPAMTPKIILTFVEHDTGILKMRDGRFCLPGTGIAVLLKALFPHLPDPVHFKVLLNEVNAMMKSGCRLGAGHILDVLKGNPGFERAASGYYRLSQSPSVTE